MDGYLKEIFQICWSVSNMQMDASLELIHMITYWFLQDYLLIFKNVFEWKHSWNKKNKDKDDIKFFFFFFTN